MREILNNNTIKVLSLILKVFIPSLLLSLMIKYLGANLTLEPTNFNALIVVLLPPAAIAVLLGWQGFVSRKS